MKNNNCAFCYILLPSTVPGFQPTELTSMCGFRRPPLRLSGYPSVSLFLVNGLQSAKCDQNFVKLAVCLKSTSEHQ